MTLSRLLSLLALSTVLSGCLINTSLRDERLDEVDDDDCEDGSAEVCDGVDNDCNGEIDDGPDADNDGVADICDACEGGDDSADADADGVADACDPCPQDAPPDDDDGDGVCNSDDQCPGSDVTDIDVDGIADGCDDCPRDAGNDVDGDGLCANVDNCPSTVACAWSSTENMSRPQDVSIRAPSGSDWHLGSAILEPVDLTGDGIPDLAIGAPGEAGGPLPGRVWIIEGPIDHDIQLLGDAAGGPQLGEALSVIEGIPGDSLGRSIDAVSDTNGDGLPELLIGAPTDGPGRAYVVPSPFVGVVDADVGGSWIECATAGATCGQSVLSIRVSGNGTSALFVGAPVEQLSDASSGAVAVMLGIPTGTGALDFEATAGSLIVDDAPEQTLIGHRLAALGDLNGDGVSELAITAPAVSPGYQSGRVCVIDPTTLAPGSTHGLSSFACWEQDWTSDTFFGSSVAPVPDADGDGLPELLIGDSGVDGNSSGAAWLVYSNWTPLNQHGQRVLSPYDYYGTTSHRLFVGYTGQEAGHAVAATDLDDDGQADILVGGDEGTTWAVFGPELFPQYGSSTLNNWARVQFVRDRVLGIVITPAGDLNGDGKGDFLLGDPGQIDGSVPQGEVLLVWGADAP